MQVNKLYENQGHILCLATSVEAQLEQFIAEYYIPNDTPVERNKKSVELEIQLLRTLRFSEKIQLMRTICVSNRIWRKEAIRTINLILKIKKNRDGVAHYGLQYDKDKEEYFLEPRKPRVAKAIMLKPTNELVDDLDQAHIRILSGLARLRNLLLKRSRKTNKPLTDFL